MLNKRVTLTRLTVINIVLAALLIGSFLSPLIIGGLRNTTGRVTGGQAAPLTSEQQQIAIGLQQSYMNVYRKADPSVVYIKTNMMVRQGVFFEHYRRIEGAGSGFIIDNEGHIVTNSHVVKGASQIEVIFHDNTRARARLIGREDSSDVALIKVPANSRLVPAILGDSDKVEPGQLAFALGSPFGLNRTFTVGTISARQRQVDNSRYSRLQTDASINPGNSGGPLLNIFGEVVGINQSIISPGGGMNAGSVGIGFAIPINEARQVIEQLKKERRVIGRPVLGVQIAVPLGSLREQLRLGDEPGLVVLFVVPGSAADEAGLQEYDFIVRINGKSVGKPVDLVKIVQESGVGGVIELDIIRKGKKRKIKATIGEDVSS